jgi:hypothetical protein
MWNLSHGVYHRVASAARCLRFFAAQILCLISFKALAFRNWETSRMTTATFAYGPANMQIAHGLVTDASGQVAVPTGAAGGSNAGAGVLAAIKVGMIPAAPATVGYVTAKAGAVTAIAAVAASPTQAQIQAALTAVLNAANALTAA